MTLDEAEAQAELDQEFLRSAIWEYKRSIWPRRCYRSGKWLKPGHHWRLIRTWSGLYGFHDEVRWLHREIGTILKLRS